MDILHKYNKSLKTGLSYMLGMEQKGSEQDFLLCGHTTRTPLREKGGCLPPRDGGLTSREAGERSIFDLFISSRYAVTLWEESRFPKITEETAKLTRKGMCGRGQRFTWTPGCLNSQAGRRARHIEASAGR